MTPWPDLLRRPPRLTAAAADRWFAAIADRLLNGSRLVAGGVPHRLVEVETYYHGPGHPDPFAHRDPVQQHPGRWYFHRTAGVYRGGSFKGIDLSFGDATSFGGVLFRGLEAPDGTLTDGPSLLVDRLLRLTGTVSVAALDREIGGRLAWDQTSPVHLADLAGPEGRPVVRTARVGLSLRRARPGGPEMGYLLRPYRFLTEPRRTAKGKPHLVLALHRAGEPADRIRAATGCPAAAIARYVAAFEAGKAEADAGPYLGREMTTADLCRLHGLAARAE